MKRFLALLVTIVFFVAIVRPALASPVVWIDSYGTVQTTWQVGGPSGPTINDNAGVIEHKDSTNSTYVIVRGATPSGSNDLTTKNYVDTKTWAVANGGTGDITLAANGVLLGEGTSAVNVSSAGTSGYPFVSNGAGNDPTFHQLPLNGGGVSGALPAANQASQNMNGDVEGTTSLNYLQFISGVSGVVVNNATRFTPASTSGATGNSLEFDTQASTNTNGTPGTYILQVPSPTGTGSHGVFSFREGTAGSGTEYFQIENGGRPSTTGTDVGIGNSGGYMWSTSSSGWIYGANGGGGVVLMTPTGIQLFNGTTTGYGGGTNVLALGTAGTKPTSACTGPCLYGDSTTGALGVNASGGIEFPSQVTSPLIQPVGVSSGNGTSMVYKAGDTSASSAIGGTSWVEGGASTGSFGTAGSGGVEANGGFNYVLAGPTLITLEALTGNYRIGTGVSAPTGTGNLFVTNASTLPTGIPTGGCSLSIWGGQLESLCPGGLTESEGYSFSIANSAPVLGQIDKFAHADQVGMSFGAVSAASQYSLPVNHSATLHCHVTATVHVAGSGGSSPASVGDSFSEDIAVLVRNVAGSIAQVGSVTVVAESGDLTYGIGGGTPSSFAFSGANPPGCTFTANTTGGGSPQVAATVSGEIVFN